MNPWLKEQRLEPRNNNVFQEKRCSRSEDSADKRIKKLECAVAFLISFIFGAFLTLVIEALFF